MEDFYCLNCHILSERKINLIHMKKYVKRKIFVKLFCHPKNNIFEFNQYIKLGKMQYIVHADVESLIEKIDNCKNNPEKYLTTKIEKIYSLWIFSVNNFHIWSYRK